MSNEHPEAQANMLQLKNLSASFFGNLSQSVILFATIIISVFFIRYFIDLSIYQAIIVSIGFWALINIKKIHSDIDLLHAKLDYYNEEEFLNEVLEDEELAPATGWAKKTEPTKGKVIQLVPKESNKKSDNSKKS